MGHGQGGQADEHHLDGRGFERDAAADQEDEGDGGEGERIYHTPCGSQWYIRTRISPGKGEQWFCSEREALDAGWRAPRR